MKVLCLGNNTPHTNTQASAIAIEYGLSFFGLISDIDNEFKTSTIVDGCYHSTVIDFSKPKFIQVIEEFDTIVLLDQKYSEWEHANTFFNTVSWVKNHPNVEYLNDEYKTVFYWQTLVNENKSFCIYPFIEYVSDGKNTTVCCRSITPVSTADTDFITDPKYNDIRNKMIEGTRIPHCKTCYDMEDSNIISSRQSETPEWANRLNLKNTSDLIPVTTPSYYEIRPSNKCNLQCRMCSPESSHLIEGEYIKLGLSQQPEYSHVGFDVVNFDNMHKLYIAGGEPTIDKHVYKFLRKCIDCNNTDFEMLINTNACSLNNSFKNIISKFSNIQFTISIDGYKEVNDYVRWLSNWDTIVKNIKYLKINFKITFNVTISIYTVSLLDELLTFIDTEHNGIHVHVSIVNTPSLLSPYNFPNHLIVLDSMERITQLDLYKTNDEIRSVVDNFINYYSDRSNKVDYSKLEEFFKFNSILDNSRGVSLNDYIPELNRYSI